MMLFQASPPCWKEKSRAKRSEASRGQEGEREAKMDVETPGVFACLLFFLVLG